VTRALELGGAVGEVGVSLGGVVPTSQQRLNQGGAGFVEAPIGLIWRAVVDETEGVGEQSLCHGAPGAVVPDRVSFDAPQHAGLYRCRRWRYSAAQRSCRFPVSYQLSR
jgi:hypothetical protein